MALLLGSTSEACASLRESIKENGGIIHPIIVNKRANGTYVVIEGNTRLQIYKDFIASGEPGNWTTIRAVVYENLEDEKITLSTENNRMNIVIQTTNDMEAEYQERVKALNKALTSVRVENATIRQILRDITNKPVNELIEAHRKAVRMLQYDKVQPCEEEAAEEKVSE
jgi:hypothetical protein